MTEARPGWDAYFMRLAKLAATRATCIRPGRHIGAVMVSSDNHILATGYNGPPRGWAHPEKVGCLRTKFGVPSGERHEICRGLHAEVNCIIQVARGGGSTVGARLYVTHQPCSICAKIIAQAGIVEVVYCSPYPDPLAEEFYAETHAALGTVFRVLDADT